MHCGISWAFLFLVTTMLDTVHGRKSICKSGEQVVRLQFPSGLLVVNGTAMHTSMSPHSTSFDSI